MDSNKIIRAVERLLAEDRPRRRRPLREFGEDEMEDIMDTAADDTEIGDAADAPAVNQAGRGARRNPQMDEAEFQQWLQVVMEDHEGSDIARVTTYEEGGVMTQNKGLIVDMADRAQFHLTIVRSR